MTTLKVGIASNKKMKARTLAIARGKRRPARARTTCLLLKPLAARDRTRS